MATLFSRVAFAAAVATYFVIVMGGVVRTTGSGLGCPDWPLCHGNIIPPLELTAIIEYFHRSVAVIASILIFGVTLGIWTLHRDRRSFLVPGTLVPLLLVAQIVLGAVTVLLELPPYVVLVHLAVALLLFGLLVWIAVIAYDPPSVSPSYLSGETAALLGSFQRRLVATLAAVFVLLMTGAYVQTAGATWACVGFPLCNGELLPFGRNSLIDTQLLHRLTAYGVAALAFFIAVRAWQLGGVLPALRPAALMVVASILFQLAVGIAAVSTGVPPLLRALHVAGAAAVWGTVVLLVSLVIYARQQRVLTANVPSAATSAASAPHAGANLRYLAATYLALTKPGIISLLLVTTLASMLVAAEGLPPLPLIAATLLGGALSAGAANTFNCYIDRDIDQLMGRTSLRPIPSGLISPNQALLFGFLLAILSVLCLGLFANWLAAALSVCGLLYYVFVYTCWLKRSSPSNIVIGGAAGAVPPLVGWAAVTGEVSLLAVYFFAIIFFWTPPHFWALALLIRREYEKANIPMLPIVRGEAETRHQILLYSVFLVAFTLLVVVFRQMGVFYLTSALLLGGLFLYHAARLFREANAIAARNLFRFSILYLALLFAAMAVDRWKIT